MARRRAHVQAQRDAVVETFRHEAVQTRAGKSPHRLRAALQGEGVNIIAEFKRASPSLGMIRRDAIVEEVVGFYEIGGAAAVSILTEQQSFHGSIEDLAAARIRHGASYFAQGFYRRSIFFKSTKQPSTAPTRSCL